MTIRVALNHQTIYRYDRCINLGPQVIRLRPAPHCRTPIDSYSLRVSPSDHYLNWQQDPFGNYLARCVFTEKVNEFKIEVDVVSTMTVINPFDFFLEPEATEFPFSYEESTVEELRPYLQRSVSGPRVNEFLRTLDYTPRRTIDFLVDLNVAIKNRIEYTLRMEPGVQSPEQTLSIRRGSCRDSGWLMVELLRQLGFASRFVSGYLIQLTADQKSLDGPSGPEKDFTDLHAWAEVFLPGAGWIGMDPTSGLFAGEGHIPLACTPQPTSAAPITGTLEMCGVEFEHHMSVMRVHEDPRVTLPYSDSQWQRIEELGHTIDKHLELGDVRLTMGGEPTFVSIDDMDGEEWQTAAVGPTKRRLAYDLLLRLKDRFGYGAVLHFGQGKWYPGEPLPRWSMAIFWRKDGERIWHNDKLLANTETNYGYTVEDAERFAKQLALRLGTNPEHAFHAFEDAMYYMWRERRLPINVDLRDSKLESKEERERIARIFEQGLTKPVGIVMPLRHVWWGASPTWVSGPWRVRSEEMFLLPGDSPMGYRLPLQSLRYEAKPEHAIDFFVRDPLEKVDRLATSDQIRQSRIRALAMNESVHGLFPIPRSDALDPVQQYAATAIRSGGGLDDPALDLWDARLDTDEPGHSDMATDRSGNPVSVDTRTDDSAAVIPTALCVEVRDGRLHVFLPPTDRLESFLELIAAIELTAEDLQLPVVIEGYQPRMIRVCNT